MASLITDQIRTAAEQLGEAGAVLGRALPRGRQALACGGWQRRPQFVTFPGGIVTQPGACSCQEGTGPIVCLHRVALAILDRAAIPPVSAAARRLADDTIARIGHHPLTICRSCHTARATAGRQRRDRARPRGGAAMLSRWPARAGPLVGQRSAAWWSPMCGARPERAAGVPWCCSTRLSPAGTARRSRSAT